jgi:hypothetical protein
MAGPVRSLLLRLDLRPTGRRCECAKKCGTVLLKGDLRFVVKEPGIATGEKGYCSTCALTMLTKSISDLETLQSQLIGTAPAGDGPEG